MTQFLNLLSQHFCLPLLKALQYTRHCYCHGCSSTLSRWHLNTLLGHWFFSAIKPYFSKLLTSHFKSSLIPKLLLLFQWCTKNWKWSGNDQGYDWLCSQNKLKKKASKQWEMQQLLHLRCLAYTNSQTHAHL